MQTSGLTNNATTSTFTTLKPTRTIRATFAANPFVTLKDGGTYGVGEPIIVNFNHPVSTADRADVEKALDVEATPAVEGRWHWMSSTSVHYRGENYWAAGSTITVHANLYGVKMGSGAYGASSPNVTIHIGDSHVLIADNKTHYMKVYVNGTMVRNIPVSMGRGGSTKGDNGRIVDYWTRSGPHVVLIKTPTHYMASNKLRHQRPELAVLLQAGDDPRHGPDLQHRRVRAPGRLEHPRPGQRNTSHGCINVGPSNAMWVYNLLIPGDVVDVTGTPVTLPVWDGLGDWTISWSKW